MELPINNEMYKVVLKAQDGEESITYCETLINAIEEIASYRVMRAKLEIPATITLYMWFTPYNNYIEVGGV